MYSYVGNNTISELDVRAGGELVLTGGQLRGPGRTYVRSGALADLTNVNLAYYDGGSYRKGSPSLTYYSGSSGGLDGVTGSSPISVASSSVSIQDSVFSSLTASASATITTSTIGYVRLNGGSPTFISNTFTNSVPFRVTDPDNLDCIHL